jgi:hypothetical protein
MRRRPIPATPALGKLVFSLSISFAVGLVCVVLGATNTGTVANFFVAVWVIGAYWLVSAVLQVWWWGRGFDRFYRPMYSWALTLLGGCVLGFVPVLVVVAVSGSLRGAGFGVAIFSPVLLLLIPRVRRWLLPKLKPYEESRGLGDGLA